MDLRVIATRLQKLDKYVRSLRRWETIPKETYLQDEDIQAIVERRLQLAIQICIDIANYLIAHHGLSAPEGVDNVFAVLGKAGVIPQPLAKRMVGMVRFRNILVHDYLEIDDEIVHRLLTTRLNDFDEFSQIIIHLFGLDT